MKDGRRPGTLLTAGQGFQQIRWGGVSEGDQWRGKDSIREEVIRGLEEPVMEWKLRLQTVEQLHLEVLARRRLTVCAASTFPGAPNRTWVPMRGKWVVRGGVRNDEIAPRMHNS